MKVKLNSILNFCLCVVLDHFQNRDSFNCNFLIKLNLRSSVFLASFFNHSVNYKPLLPNCNNFPAARKIIVSILSPSKKERKKLSKLNFNISIKNNYYILFFFIFYLFRYKRISIKFRFIRIFFLGYNSIFFRMKILLFRKRIIFSCFSTIIIQIRRKLSFYCFIKLIFIPLKRII